MTDEQPPDAVLAGTCECDLGECTCPASVESPTPQEGKRACTASYEWDGVTWGCVLLAKAWHKAQAVSRQYHLYPADVEAAEPSSTEGER